MEAWQVIREIFYEYFGQSAPNAAHLALAEMEQMGQLDVVITQNIDNLHQAAGSQDVIEFHGNSHRLSCTVCDQRVPFTAETIATLPPRCAACGAVLKPDFVFFGEPIPFLAQRRAMAETTRADVWLVIGTTGGVYPAALLPIEAKRNGKTIIEVNVRPSEFTGQITDLFLQGQATEVLSALVAQLRDGV
jgi:NAD-dependent deacetylase